MENLDLFAAALGVHAPDAPFHLKYAMQWHDVAGKGVSGCVRRCYDLESGVLCAIKILPFSSRSLSEIEAWKNVSPHPHIVSLLDVFDTGVLEHGNPMLFHSLPAGRYLFAVMENLTGGELFDFLAQPYDEATAAMIVGQVVSALQHIHSCGYVHGDLKLENIVFRQNGSLHVSLVDFGFARRTILPQGHWFTLFYTAPELIQSFDNATRLGAYLPVGYSADMWALGVITYMVLVRGTPFFSRAGEHGHNNGKTMTPYFRTCVGHGIFPKPVAWSALTALAQDFVQSLLVVDAELRASANVASAHAWLNHGQVQQLLLDPLAGVAEPAVVRPYDV